MGTFGGLETVQNINERTENTMATDKVKALEPFEKIGLLYCALAILERMEDVDPVIASHMAGALYRMFVQIDEPGLFASIRTLEADLLEDQELDKSKLVALRLLITVALTDVEQEQEQADG